MTESAGWTALVGDELFFAGVRERKSNLWALSLRDGNERVATDLSSRRGSVGVVALSSDGEHLYFTWEEDLGDIWVMDVVQE